MRGSLCVKSRQKEGTTSSVLDSSGGETQEDCKLNFGTDYNVEKSTEEKGNLCTGYSKGM